MYCSLSRFERESSSYKTEVADLQSHVEELQRSGSSLDKKLRLAEEQLTEMNSKVHTFIVLCVCVCGWMDVFGAYVCA